MMNKKILEVATSVMMITIVLLSCNSDTDETFTDETRAVNMVYPEKTIQLTSQQRTFVNANNTFAFKLFQEISKQESDKSSFCSPLSVTFVLGMLNAGAEGATQKEIQDVLGFNTDNPADINAYCENLIKSAPEIDPKVKLKIANGIFINNAIAKIAPSYQEEMEQYYEALIEDLDFANVRNVDKINEWCKKQTDGMIPKILEDEEFKRDAVMFLLNAFYFKADWTEKFDEKYTKKADFITEFGTKEVNMMHQKVYVRYGETEDYSVISLPYGDGAFSMLLVLPKNNKDIDEVVNCLKPELLADNSLGIYEVDVKIPRWETSAKIQLIPILQKMGINRMFDPKRSELSKMTESGSLYVYMMKQLANIEVNESGSKAAAGTIAGTMFTSIDTSPKEPQKAEFHADHPFLYIITERGSNAIFFIGKYMGN